jgi:hypothetical protein
MTTKLLLGKDLNGNVTYQIPFTDTGYETTLVAGVAQSLVVPANCTSAWFSYSSGIDVFVDPLHTATLPGAVFASTTADMNPVARSVVPGSTLSFISDAAGYVKVSFYEIAGYWTGQS